MAILIHIKFTLVSYNSLNKVKGNKMKILLSILSIGLILVGCGGNGGGKGNSANGTPPTMEVSDTLIELTEAQKYALAFMWHEEKLAFDIYYELNKIHPVKQFTNIQKAELKHISAVETLIKNYDINITNIEDYTINYSVSELQNMPVGKYAIAPIQSLYDMLYNKGIKSTKDALEVACMVEVTDIDDLDKYIIDSQGKNDLIETFTFLKEGSYSHYWAFDKALKNIGVSNGCCSAGEEWCHNEYPQSH